MSISKFDRQIQKALESVVKGDFDKVRLQLGALETNIKRNMKGDNDFGKLSQIKRVRMIRAGLFNKKIKK